MDRRGSEGDDREGEGGHAAVRKEVGMVSQSESKANHVDPKSAPGARAAHDPA